MNIIVCPKCEKRVQNDYGYCTNCGTKIKVINDKVFLTLILIIISVISVTPLIIKYGFKEPKKLTRLEAEDYVERLIRKELLIKIDAVTNKAHVSLMVWSLFSKNQKEEISRNLSVYCSYKKGLGHNFISILDTKTDRVLATYDIKGKFTNFKY
ncbi:MAG: hypothetical protein KAJ14_06310 [Candidatus Omnitrophica bacterium]|nr:hypothetical protein [Candidatus Omnitrophota bacterium]